MSVASAKIKSRTDKETRMTKLNFEQASRYRELMWIAQFGDYMSNAEFEELGNLLKIRGYH